MVLKLQYLSLTPFGNLVNKIRRRLKAAAVVGTGMGRGEKRGVWVSRGRVQGWRRVSKTMWVTGRIGWHGHGKVGWVGGQTGSLAATKVS